MTPLPLLPTLNLLTTPKLQGKLNDNPHRNINLCHLNPTLNCLCGRPCPSHSSYSGGTPPHCRTGEVDRRVPKSQSNPPAFWRFANYRPTTKNTPRRSNNIVKTYIVLVHTLHFNRIYKLTFHKYCPSLVPKPNFTPGNHSCVKRSKAIVRRIFRSCEHMSYSYN